MEDHPHCKSLCNQLVLRLLPPSFLLCQLNKQFLLFVGAKLRLDLRLSNQLHGSKLSLEVQLQKLPSMTMFVNQLNKSTKILFTETYNLYNSLVISASTSFFISNCDWCKIPNTF